MKLNKFMIVSIILLAIVTFGAVSAAEDVTADNPAVGESDAGDIKASDVETGTGGDVATLKSASNEDIQDTAVLGSNNASGDKETKLGATDGEILSASNNGDATVQDAGNRNTVQGNQEYQDPLKATNIVTQGNFFDFFDDDGILRDEITFDELIFNGDFSGLTDYVILNRPISIIGDEAVLNEMGIVVASSDVSLKDLALKATSSLGDLVNIQGNNVLITGFDIDYATGEEDGRAINAYQVKNVIINNTNINYESHVTSDEKEAGAINIEDCDDVNVTECSIITSLPALTVTAYDPTDMFMGLNTVNPIRISGSKRVSILNNGIISINNDYSQLYATIQAILVKNSPDCLIDGNNINLIDDIAQPGEDIYLYGITFSNNTNLMMSNNNFTIHTVGGKDGAGTAYAIQGISSSLTFVKNNITTFSNGPNIGVYVTSMSGEDAYTRVEFNNINVTGYAAPTSDWALVTGIEIQNGNTEIYNNTIYTYNVGEYDDKNYMYGVSYTQWMYGSRIMDIRDNTIVTDGKYTVCAKEGTELTVIGNYLIAYELTGDASVDPNTGEGVIVKDNEPTELTNIVTQDNFFDFFDDNGILRDSVAFDELIFQGEFADLDVAVITINRPISIVGDDAVLYDMAYKIISDGVKLDNVSLLADGADFSDNHGAVVFVDNAAGVVLENLIISYNTPEDIDSYAVYANKATDFELLNSTIEFDANNGGQSIYHGIEIRDCEGVLIKDNEIGGSLASQDVSWAGSGIDKDLPLLIGIQNGEDIVLSDNVISVVAKPGSGDYATLDAIMGVGFKGLTITKNNITQVDFSGEGKASYTYTIDLYECEDVLIEYNNILVNTTTGVEAAGTAYPIQLTGPFTGVVIDNNNLTSEGKGPNCGIFAAHYSGGVSEALITNNFFNITGYATANNWALVSGIEFEGTLGEIYNNTIYVQSIGSYDDNNSIYGISFAQVMGSSREFDISGNTIYADGKYAVYLGDAVNSNVTENTLYAHELTGDNAAVAIGNNNIIENNYPQDESTIIVDATNVFIGQSTTVTVTVPGGAGKVNIKINGQTYSVDLDDGYVEYELPASVLVAGENTVEVEFIPEGSTTVLITNFTTFMVLDGVVTNVTYPYYFGEDHNLVDIVPEGATLDFQGLFVGDYVTNINKPVNIVSTTEDALFTTGAGNKANFNIVAGGDYTNLTGLSFVNYCVFVKGASYVTIDGINVKADARGVGSGTGFVSVHSNAYYTTVKNCYMENGGTGSSMLVLGKGGKYATFDNNVFNVTGSSGNILSSNVFVGTGNNPEFVNYTNNLIVSSVGSSSTMYGITVCGQGNIIENNTLINFKGNAIVNQFGATSTKNIYRNNNITGGGTMAVGTYSLVENNTLESTLTVTEGCEVYGNDVKGLTVSGKNVVAGGNTIVGTVSFTNAATNTTFVGNDVAGKVNVNSNNNNITGNIIESTGLYVVDLKSSVATTGNIVTDNWLVASESYGDGAVNGRENNIVKDNLPVFDSDILIDVADVWIGNDNNIVITVPNASGKVNIKINGETYSVDLNDSVAEYVLPASALVAGENTVEVEFIPEGLIIVVSSNSTTFMVLDGVVTNVTYPYYFGEDHNLVDIVPEGATLDFQGLFVGDYVTNINKPVNIVSTTEDALFTTGAGNKANLNILAGGDHTNVTGLSFVNYCVFVKGASYVTIDGINVKADARGVGSGTGFVSVHSNAYYTTVKNCYMENGGTGSSMLVLGKGGKYATFDNNVFNVTGSSGNILSSNVFVGQGDNPEFVNYTNNLIVSSVAASSTMYGITVCGQGNIIENNTLINFKGNAIVNQFGATSTKNIYRNNTITGGGSMAVGTYSLVENNTLESTLTVTEGCEVYGNDVKGLTVSGKNVVAQGNTIAGAVSFAAAAKNTTFIGNQVEGTLTVNSNNNTIKENYIESDGDYAVDLKTTTDNKVTDNWLFASELYGDDAVNANENNIVKDNLPYKPNLTVVVENITVGEDAVIILKVNPDANGTVIVNVNGQLMEVEISEGEERVNVTGLSASDYTVTASFVSDVPEFGNGFASAVFNVAKIKSELIISVPSDIKAGDSPIINISIPNATGSVSVIIDGVEQTADLVDGIANVTIENIKAGSHNIVVVYNGDKNVDSVHNSTTFEAQSIVKDSILIGGKLEMTVGDGSKFTVTLTDKDGNPIAGKVIKFIIVGKTYTYRTDVNGNASLPINLKAGSYPITVVFDGDADYKPSNAVVTSVEVYTNTRIVENKDLVKKEGGSEKFTVRALDKYGKPVGAYAKVKMTVAGKTYTVNTDANGYASLPINLKAGTYQIVTEYGGTKVTNKITIKKK